MTKFLNFSLFLLLTFQLTAQDLDPRAYIRLPKNTHTAILGYSYSFGSVVTDPTLQIDDLNAVVQTASIGYARSFGLFGKSSQISLAIPFSRADVSGKVVGQAQSTSRLGLADSRLKMTVLVIGAPATGLEEFLKAKRKTIVGLSLNVGIPTGQFFSDKLINIGTNRWSFRPEIGVSQPIGKRWLFDFYSGVWLFTTNYSFFPGDAARSQEPMGAFQMHFSYNITPRFWIAYNATYYVGGASSINGDLNDDRQSNTRVGLTAVFPVGKFNSIKLAASTGAVVRVGQDFTSFNIGWQRSWFGKTAKDKSK